MGTSLTQNEDPMTSGQRRSIVSVVSDATESVLEGFQFTNTEAQEIHKRGNELKAAQQKFLQELLPQLAGNNRAMLAEQEKFYRELFGKQLNFDGVLVPLRRTGLGRLMVVPDLSVNYLYDACAERFPCWHYADNLDKAVPHHDRTATKGSYAIWLRDGQEADAEFSYWSAEKVWSRNVVGITLPERLILELQYFSATGQHLDIHSITLCTGSRDAVGDVPGVFWRDGKLSVSWCSPSNANGLLRCREVVSN